ncbi:hypothetical protein PVAND_006083 [Polypedilum vanderplanki]|uniref:Uncharacterized protein n=1 Tax=Polypedilum vanderplanki TaxID=319348 RepID=A0A9J6C2I2_POLVA|nr:hypothetical protein PVAND_006083 [Polypedilum vanderplanki]
MLLMNYLKNLEWFLVYNNINQRFFRKIVWRLATLPEITDASDNLERNISTFLKKIELVEWTPDEKLMDEVLNVDKLQTIQEFAAIYGDCASMLTFEDCHWPVQDDHVPSSISTRGKYDVNLIFERDGKMRK